MQSEFSIAVSKDASEIVALVNSAYRGESSRIGWTTEAEFLDGQRIDEESFLKRLDLGHIVLCLREGERLLACVELTKKDAGSVLLGMLTVGPQLQNQGLGAKLMKHAENFARDKLGAKKIVMKVISLRHELIAYYQRKSYILTDEYEGFPYGDIRLGIPKIENLQFVLMEKKFSISQR